LRDDADLEDGAFHRWVVGYYDNGHKQYERRYVSGKRIGPDKSYDVRGNLQSVDYYDPPGDLTRREYYDKGKLLRTVRL
jgi:antitoxin component YwqK of YwqJK toxin-antitoxin module